MAATMGNPSVFVKSADSFRAVRGDQASVALFWREPLANVEGATRSQYSLAMIAGVARPKIKKTKRARNIPTPG